MPAEKKCEFCDKRGLPILLVRDAVARANLDAPLAPSLPVELPEGIAQYTKRLLRPGYLNVFDEARNRWETYFVTPESYLFKLHQSSSKAPIVPTKPFNCADEGHRALASCITVQDPQNATTLWIGFSDVLWTDAVRKAHLNRAMRERHMVAVDVKAAIRGKQSPHRPIAQLATIVAEYSMSLSRAKQAFYGSPFPLATRQDHATRLIKECDSLRPATGLIVTVPDPCGIVQEIAFLIGRQLELFVDTDPAEKLKLSASMSIEQLKHAIRAAAEKGEIAAAEELSEQQIRSNPLGYAFSAYIRSKTEALRTVTVEEINNVKDKTWQRYAEKYDEQARAYWHRSFQERLGKYEDTHIFPMAAAYIAWMKSERLADQFICNFDVEDLEAGIVYTALFLQCTELTHDLPSCRDLYEEWLGGDPACRRNLLLRAMVHNNDALANAVKNAAKDGIGLSQIPWDNLFAMHTSAVKQLEKDSGDVLGRLLASFAAPLMRMFDKVLDGSARFRSAIIATGLISGQPVVIWELVGTRKQFREYLARELIRAGGGPAQKHQLRRAVKQELERQAIKGEKIDGTEKRRWIALGDREQLSNALSEAGERQRSQNLARSIRSIESIEAQNLTRWRTVINQDVRLGILGGILQTLNLVKLVGDEEKSLKNNMSDAAWRRRMGVAALAATTSEVIGNALVGRAKLGLRHGQGIVSKSGRSLMRVGGMGGMAAGVVVATLDLCKAWSEYKEGNALTTGLYAAAGFAGGMLSVAVYFSFALPVIAVLILLVIGLNFAMDAVKDDPIQDWLERCPWGRLAAQRYSDIETLEGQLKLAMG